MTRPSLAAARELLDGAVNDLGGVVPLLRRPALADDLRALLAAWDASRAYLAARDHAAAATTAEGVSLDERLAAMAAEESAAEALRRAAGL